MTKDVLLRRLEALAGPRYGVQVSARKLRDWVEVGLVPGPRTRGRRRGQAPVRDWSCWTYRRALQVCRLKSRGVKTNSQIITLLWLWGARYPIRTVRPAVLACYRRTRRSVRRELPEGWDPRSNASMDRRTERALGRILGGDEPGPDVAWLPPEALRALAESMVFGITGPGALKALSTALHPFGFDSVPDPQAVLSLLEQELSAVHGVLADPDEVPGAAEDAIAHTDQETFDNAREAATMWPDLVWAVPAMAAVAMDKPLGAVDIPAVPGGHDPWRALPLFVAFLQRAKLRGDRGRGIAMMVRLLRIFRRLVTFVSSDQETQATLRALVPGASSNARALLETGAVAGDVDKTSIRWLTRRLWRHGLADLFRLRRKLGPYERRE